MEKVVGGRKKRNEASSLFRAVSSSFCLRFSLSFKLFSSPRDVDT